MKMMRCSYCNQSPCHPSCDFLYVKRNTFSLREPGMSSECLEEDQLPTKSDRNTPFDIQVGGDHYKNCAIQPIDYILENGLGYLEGNVIKYVTRHDKKSGIEDLEKAKHYIDLIIEKKYK